MKRRVVTFLAFLLTLPAATATADFSFNFDNQSDAGLTRYNPLAAVGFGGTYSFPQLSPGNFGYLMQAPAVPQVGGLAGVGAIIGSLNASQTFSDVNASVDFTRWNDTNDQVMLVTTRSQVFADGTFSGYVLEYFAKGSATTGALNIDRIDHGVATVLGTSALLTLDPTHTYRLSMQDRGSVFTGQVADVTNPGMILASASLTDSTYASGFVGFGAGAAQNGATTIGSAVDVTFDNFRAAAVPEPASVAMLGIGLAGAMGYGWRRRVRCA